MAIGAFELFWFARSVVRGVPVLGEKTSLASGMRSLTILFVIATTGVLEVLVAMVSIGIAGCASLLCLYGFSGRPAMAGWSGGPEILYVTGVAGCAVGLVFVAGSAGSVSSAGSACVADCAVSLACSYGFS